MTAVLTELIAKRQSIPENGPEPPDRLWLDGIRYEGFSGDEFTLLTLVWGKPVVSVTDVMESIWADELTKGNALKKLLQRLNRKLAKKQAPLTILKKTNQLYIQCGGC